MVEGKRANTLETTLLALEILRRVPRAPRQVSADEILQQLRDAGFTRDLRTIQRQLDALSEHFKLERNDRSKPYGYSWPRHADGLSLPNLTLQESLLLRLAEDYLRNILPTRLMHSMEGFFAQARQDLGPGASESLEREWLKKVRVVATSQPKLPPKIKPDVFDAVCEALYGNRWLHVDYENQQRVRSTVQVMPLGLVQQGERLYLVCRYEGYDNERSLALHRMHSARATTLTFKRPNNFDLKKFDDDGRFGFGDGKKVRLTFRIGKGAGYHLLESRLSEDQVVKELKGEYEISVTVVDSEMLMRWLRGFGDAVSRIRKRTLPET